MTTQGSLALCLWEIGVQPKDRNSYAILLFNPGSKFELHIVEMEGTVTNAREALSRLFGFSDPPKISFEKPRSSLKQIFSELNPATLFNHKYIPSAAIMPKSTDEIYLCMDNPTDSLKLGLILVTSKPATAVIKSDAQLIDLTMRLFARVYVESICYGSIPKHNIDTLNTLLSYAMGGVANREDLSKN